MVIIWKTTVEMSLRHSLLTSLPDVHPTSACFPGGTWSPPLDGCCLLLGWDVVPTCPILAQGCWTNTKSSCQNAWPWHASEGLLNSKFMSYFTLSLGVEPLRRSHSMFFSANMRATKTSHNIESWGASASTRLQRPGLNENQTYRDL